MLNFQINKDLETSQNNKQVQLISMVTLFYYLETVQRYFAARTKKHSLPKEKGSLKIIRISSLISRSWGYSLVDMAWSEDTL